MMINNNANAVSLPSHKYMIKGYEGESMDELDRSIVTILESNGRASNAEISRSLNVSEGTVRRRLKKLINDQIINIAGLADPKKLGYESEALIGIQVDPGKVEAALESIHAAFSSGGVYRSEKVIKTEAHNSDQKESSLDSMHNMVSELRDVMSQSLSNDMK